MIVTIAPGVRQNLGAVNPFQGKKRAAVNYGQLPPLVNPEICILWTNHDYLEGKGPLLIRDMLVKFGDILTDSNKSSAFWDMGWSSIIKWLPMFSPDEAQVRWHQSNDCYK